MIAMLGNIYSYYDLVLLDHKNPAICFDNIVSDLRCLFDVFVMES